MISGPIRTYPSLMVFVDPSSHAESRVALSGSLASRFGSRLIGVAAEEAAIPYLEDGQAAARSILVENARNAAAERLAQAESNFRRGAGHLSDIEWRSDIRSPAQFLASQAQAADLVIVARPPSSDASHRRMCIDPGVAVLELGRPVLVVPPDGGHILARSIVVAWKNTREARRAVLDALPFLQRAETVTVLSVDDDGEDPSAKDVCAHLSRHGVSSRQVSRRSRSGSCADALVDAAAEEGSDLIVSGAYGHSRMQEWIFGGVTRALLDSKPIPCLMSH